MIAVTDRSPSNADAFAKVDAWVFDLDNTLYPHRTDLFAQIDVRMTAYVAELLSLEPTDARLLQKQLYREHGTTMAGLMARHNIDPDDFLLKVHDIDYSPVEANPALGAAIRNLPGRKFIFTNGDQRHAQRTAERLGILNDFDAIFDIVAAKLIPKPDRAPYEAFAALHGVNPERAAMFEDLARNLVVPKALGMRTVLVVPNNFEPTFSEVWERDKGFTDEVDFVTDDLAGFLEQVTPRP